jgi:hypothetical protein
LGQKIPAYPGPSPAPTHFLPKKKSTTLPSRIIPVPVSSPSKPYRDSLRDRRRAKWRRAEQRRAEWVAGGDESRLAAPYQIAAVLGVRPAPPFLVSDRRCRPLRFLSGNLRSISPFLFYPRLTAASPHHSRQLGVVRSVAGHCETRDGPHRTLST